MRIAYSLVIALALFLGAGCSASPGEPVFAVLDVYIDAGEKQLSAYQLELRLERARIVGVQGGDAPFDEPPHYDPAALQGGRIVVGAFTTVEYAPHGKVRVARLHILATGRESYRPTSVSAARPGGQRIAVEATIQRVE